MFSLVKSSRSFCCYVQFLRFRTQKMSVQNKSPLCSFQVIVKWDIDRLVACCVWLAISIFLPIGQYNLSPISILDCGRPLLNPQITIPAVSNACRSMML
ncbi:hypothetical protein TNIN_498371 [Trichonephila inaurata madagascariensis]|uniref:Uncharacterized protein n=1 Tax=Trichonephila inaurata madagascariensis TaxID=2747483 RepID=A0A8X6YQI8_9ARAC|nr:hypothetical protein TNIN_498371 [Trichonephila inaurata madagascariensis]